MKEPPNVFNYIPFFFGFLFSFWNVITNACLRHHPKSRAALHIATTLENFDLKAITVLIRKKNDISTVISFIFLFSFVIIDSTIHHGCMRLKYYFKNECKVSSGFPSTKKLMEALFSSAWKPWWNLMHNYLNSVSIAPQE